MNPASMEPGAVHLIEVAHLPHIDLTLYPFMAGAHPSIGSAFTLLRFADTASMDCVYLENVL